MAKTDSFDYSKPAGEVDSSETSVPDKLTLEDVAQNIKDGKFTNIIFMVGAGISTAAGIPDFRSPESGLYSNLQRLNLPYPEAVFDISYLRKNPMAFYTLANELYPGKFEPTLFHKFMKLVDDRGLLRRLYTQNIDTLERIAGVSGEKVIEAHGSFAQNHCIDCGSEMSNEELKRIVWETVPGKTTIPRCKGCNGIVKPDIVFFGESLPSKFFECMDEDLPESADLVIVAGTSLTVSPFSQLPEMVDDECVRLLFNMDIVGDIGDRDNDVVVLGDCDENIKKFCEMCGWILEDEERKEEAKEEANEEANEKEDSIVTAITKKLKEVELDEKTEKEVEDGDDK